MTSVEIFKTFPELFEILRNISESGYNIYLVGGALRDYLLGRQVHDLDFVIDQGARQVGKTVANALDGDFYMLDEVRQTARVIVQDSLKKRWIVDIATFRGGSLDEDLASRDFTINAIALDMKNPDRLVDPLGGHRDLRAKKIRTCSPTAFFDDPIRILRAVRQAVLFQFAILPETLQAIRVVIPNLTRVSPERQRDEFFRILESPRPDVALRLLENLGILDVLFPELVRMRGVEQSPPHTLPVWEHTLAMLQEMDNLFSVLVDGNREDQQANLRIASASLWLGRYRTKLTDHYRQSLVIERSIRGLLFLAGLYHDVAKPQTRQIDQDGRIRFIGHEVESTKMAIERARSLAFSVDEIKRLEIIIRNHMRIHLLTNSREEVSRRACYRYFRDTGAAGLDICLHSLADLLAVYGTTLPQDKWLDELKVCRSLLDAWYDRSDEVVNPPRLLSGHDLQTIFHLKPGIQIGFLLELIREAQVTGEVTDRTGAIELVRVYLSENS